MIYSLIFIMLAAICNAIMDTITYHWYESIFCGFVNRHWWDPEVSWRNKYKQGQPYNGLKKWWIFDAQFTDAWHTFKSLMIVLIALAIITFNCLIIHYWYEYIIMFIVYGLLWNLTFSLFYNKLLKSKNYK